MTKIAEDYQSNISSVLASDLSPDKKQAILQTFSKQLLTLCNEKEVPDLTARERHALRNIYIETKKAVHHLEGQLS